MLHITHKFDVVHGISEMFHCDETRELVSASVFLGNHQIELGYIQMNQKGVFKFSRVVSIDDTFVVDL